MTLVDADGKPIPKLPAQEEDDACPTCMAGSEHQDKQTMFGGYYKIVCRKCWNTVRTGRETVEVSS